MNGWTQIENCGGGVEVLSGGHFFNCAIEGTAPEDWYPGYIDDDILDGDTSEATSWEYTDPISVRKTGGWQQPGDDRKPVRPAKPYPQYHPRPKWRPAVQPESIPVPAVPMPFPEPIPYDLIPKRHPNPFRSPFEQTTRGPQPDPRPRIPQNSYGIYSPLQSQEFTPKRLRQPKRLKPRRGLAPPRYNEKEKKFVVALPKALGGFVNIFTEFDDFMDALYGALPGSLQTATNAFERWAIVWEHFLQINWELALYNLVGNQWEDLAIGSVGRFAKYANRYLGWSVGVGVGPAL
jgi:hypothetical protein